MKKIMITLIGLLVLVGCAGSGDKTDAGFDSSKDISVVSREDGSGTRGAFVELLKIEEKDADGNKKDKTTQEAIIANKTDVMMNNIANDTYAIGYLSLGSLNDTVKGLKIDGVEPTVENIKSGSYKVARPFNIVLGDKQDEATEDFVKYVLSKEGQAVVEANGYIATDTDYSYENTEVSGKIVIAGSSSVSPVMEKLVEAYKAINTGVTIEIQTSDSTAGVQAAIDGTANIGMASRELKEEEAAKVEGVVIGIDGIVIVVNNANTVTDLTSEQVKDIYVGNIETWDKVVSE